MKKHLNLMKGGAAVVAAAAVCLSLSASEVVIMATGGTIAGVASGAGAAVGYEAAKLGADSLVDAIAEIRKVTDVRAVQAMQLASESMTLDKLFELADKVRDELRKESVSGVVITHGTDTLEETAYFLNLVLDTEKPVVCVGAMRPATAYGADGPANLYDAVVVAASPKVRGLGVLIVMNNTLIPARYAYKGSTIRPSSFIGGEEVAVGSVTSGRVFVNAAPVPRHTTKSEFRGMVRAGQEIPRVEVVYCCGGEDAAMIEGAIEHGAKGVVLACVGDGSISAQMRPKVKELAAGRGFPIVRSSRVPTGPVVRNGEANDDEYKTVPAGSINPAKSRVLLTLCLMRGYDHRQITAAFETH